MDGIELRLRVEENRARTIDRRLDEERNRNENREPMNQDQDGSSEKKSDREQNAQPKRTRSERSQDVKERRESNRTSMTNLAEKRLGECNRDQITIGMNRNQIESNEGMQTRRGELFKRENVFDRSRRMRSKHLQGCHSRPRVRSSNRKEGPRSHFTIKQTKARRAHKHHINLDSVTWTESYYGRTERN
jgi:hypothetical protein